MNKTIIFFVVKIKESYQYKPFKTKNDIYFMSYSINYNLGKYCF